MKTEIPRLPIISGGQTGVDRAALDVALTRSLPIGGGGPKGRRAEDGMIPDRDLLTEIPEADYDTRTRRKVEDADGTLIPGVGTDACSFRRAASDGLSLDVTEGTVMEGRMTALRSRINRPKYPSSAPRRSTSCSAPLIRRW